MKVPSRDREPAQSEASNLVPVAVLLPIAGAAEALERCLTSLERPAGVPFRLILILDGPQPKAVETLVHAAEQRFAESRVVQLPESGGYGRAILAGEQEVDDSSDEVWLNSDTELPSAWLAALLEVATSRPRVASVTPWTNCGTLASFPVPFTENLLPRGWDVEALAEEAQRTSREPFPELPTGVGFCLFVRRKARVDVGPLDAKAFAPGYGEEVDWCLRARRLGWCHLLATNTFVYHRGAASFGEIRRDLFEKRADLRLRWRYTEWRRELTSFLAQDPLRPARERFRHGLFPRRAAPQDGSLRILHVVHGFPPHSHGGSERFAELLTSSQVETGHEVAVLARFEGAGRRNLARVEELADGVRIRWLSRPFTEHNPLSRNAIWSPTCRREVRAFVQEFHPQIVHIHHLAALSFDALNDIFPQKLPIVLQLQDWWLECQRAHRMDWTEHLCPGSHPWRCSRCQPLTRIPPRRLLGLLGYCLRRHLARQVLERVDLMLTASPHVLRDLQQAGLLKSQQKVRLVPYGVDANLQRKPNRPLPSESKNVVGFLGTLLPHKGLHLLLAALDQIAEPDRPLLRIWGRAVDAEYAQRLNLSARTELLEWRSNFESSELAEFFGSISLLVVPSVGLESFGYAAAEALAAGVPVLAADSGSLSERLSQGGGRVFRSGDAAALAKELVDLCQSPKKLVQLSQTVPTLVSFSETALTVERHYRELLGRK